MSALSSYMSSLTTEFGRGWNRFWFTPVRPATLGLIRLVFGLISLAWYLSYYPEIEFLFGPEGIVDRTTLDQWRGGNPVFSIFDFPETTSSLGFAYCFGAA